MNRLIALQRKSEVLKKDIIDASQADFMVTHVPMRKLQLLDHFAMEPSVQKTYSEQEVYESIVKNPNDEHQFIIVYGISGVGKSHLIRWFATKLKHDAPDEIVVMIRRNDNSLKGTIRQLLNLPEVENLADKDLYQKLIDASVVEDEESLKNKIYYSFVTKVKTDTEKFKQAELKIKDKKELVSFLKNSIIEQIMLADDGPVDRIFSQIAERGVVERDLVPRFLPDDFLTDGLTLQRLSQAEKKGDVERGCWQLTQRFNVDERLKKQMADYLNLFVNAVIQESANIQPGDFEELFRQIRQELYRQGKTLTLFIEDITSFTGVDGALVNVLTTSHTGTYQTDQMCRVSSIVGTTNIYFQNYFNDNYQQRVSRFIHIPSETFDSDGMVEFVARYLNAMSLEENKIEQWLNDGAYSDQYPVANVVEGNGWDSVEIESGKSLNLYPFTRLAIQKIVELKLMSTQRSPRYIISSVIEPIVNEALNALSTFPSEQLCLNWQSLKPSVMALQRKVRNEINDLDTATRWICFASVWGNGQPYKEKRNGRTYLAGIPESFYTDLQLPLIDFPENDINSEVSSSLGNSIRQTKDSPATQFVTPTNIPVNSQTVGSLLENSVSMARNHPDSVQQDQLSPVALKALENIAKWGQGSGIAYSSTGQEQGVLQKAVGRLNDIYKESIKTWQAEGISNDFANRVWDKPYKYVIGLKGQEQKTKSVFYMDPTYENQQLLDAMVRHVTLGNGESWGYENGVDDLLTLTNWIYANRKKITKAIMDLHEPQYTSVEQVALALEIWRQILEDKFSGKKIQDFKVQNLYDSGNNFVKSKNVIRPDNQHSKEWNALREQFLNKSSSASEAQKIARQAFNIIQGSSDNASVYFLDSMRMNEVWNKVYKSSLKAESFNLNPKASLTNENDLYKQLQVVFEKAEVIQNKEKEIASGDYKFIREKLHIEGDNKLTQELLTDYVKQVRECHKAINENNISVSSSNQWINQVKNNVKEIAEAYQNILRAFLVDDNPATVMILFSQDPVSKLKPLVESIQQEEKLIKAVQDELEKRLAKMEKTSENERYYEEIQKALEVSLESLEDVYDKR